MKNKIRKQRPKTIKGYILLLRLVEDIDPTGLKGFSKLTKGKQEELINNWAEFSNIINEL